MSFNLILKLHTVKSEIYPQVLLKSIICFQAKQWLTDTYGQHLAQCRHLLWLERMLGRSAYTYYTVLLLVEGLCQVVFIYQFLQVRTPFACIKRTCLPAVYPALIGAKQHAKLFWCWRFTKILPRSYKSSINSAFMIIRHLYSLLIVNRFHLLQNMLLDKYLY